MWVINDGHARQAVVRTAGEVGSNVRITGGLNGGETVIVGGGPTRDGQRVRVVE